jgi:carboxypeptidase D
VTPSKSDNFFFWMWGNDGVKPAEEIVIFMNGGPGCSSLYGLMIENGPFLYPSKKLKPYVNQYSWTREAIMVYVELPIGVGFTTGPSNISNEDQLAQQFTTFLDNFFVTFPELKGKKLFIAGESYAAYCEFSIFIRGQTYLTDSPLQMQPTS